MVIEKGKGEKRRPWRELVTAAKVIETRKMWSIHICTYVCMRVCVLAELTQKAYTYIFENVRNGYL